MAIMPDDATAPLITVAPMRFSASLRLMLFSVSILFLFSVFRQKYVAILGILLAQITVSDAFFTFFQCLHVDFLVPLTPNAPRLVNIYPTSIMRCANNFIPLPQLFLKHI